jgi:L-serine dehydratase
MAISVFDLFKIGIGPSSSHTVGPMRAAALFAHRLESRGLLNACAHVTCDLLGSLGATGVGHGSDRAVLLGLMGQAPDTVPLDRIAGWIDEVRRTGRLALLERHEVRFEPMKDLRLLGAESLPFHPNAMRLCAFDANGQLLWQQVYYSVGGGFVISDEAVTDAETVGRVVPQVDALPHPFHSAAELLAQAEAHQCPVAELMRRNERHWRTDAEIRAGLQAIWSAMQACVERGLRTDDILPGGLHVRRRAPGLYGRLRERALNTDPLLVMDWVNLYAMAVNEENAAGGRVVTAPTNGAAGIIPAVLHYYGDFVDGASPEGVESFLLTAGAIGMLYKENASISGAEVGCPGEVGVACSMAAAGLCAVLGGSPAQIENAAEIGMEHHLGLTCDPVAGLVQIPCIERNALASAKAINAARLALHGDGHHRVSLDQVIRTMKETGADMQSKYKETSAGGLALTVNVIAC